MSEFLGSRISLISKSDIRYSGILHEINSEESTVSLENVKSFGTEGRKGNPDEEIAPSDQVYEYIVFRGSDVKDLRIEQAPAPPKENQPPKVPDDPAIVGARTRPQGPQGHQVPQGPPGVMPPGPGAPGYGQSPYQPNPFYPPPPAQWGRGGHPGPVPGQGFPGMPYPPPPGWFPPGQGFPAGGPGAPGPWNSFGYPPGPGPQGPPGVPGQGMRVTPQQDGNKPVPIGAGVDKQRVGGHPAVELPTEPKSLGQQPMQPVSSAAPTPPVESKPTAAEVKATADSLTTTNAPSTSAPEKKSVPTGPKSNRVTPVVPIPPPTFASKLASQVTATAVTTRTTGEQANGPVTAATLKDATQAAKAAVASAMAKLDNPRVEAPVQAQPQPQNGGNLMDNLTKKVNEMRINASRNPTNGRGRGRGGRGGGASKVNVPDADFDFAAGNAKFNKQDVKGAIGGSPVTETSNGPTSEQSPSEEPTAVPVAYNKTRSFFDNISSEAKDRAENGGQKPGGREWRGEEQRKNMETFGQGSVDGGYRGAYRGRGRGRGNSRGRGFGGPRGRGNSFRQATTQ
ncbi:Scd6-like Sm domain-containing protein [Annulohypoxylon maeteangense]|uniref:Scd6-like Sm domain-containing protein n=1 Tax=Annulohypoxylon maeteangense TaxID=1927788 RepID=UPI0020086325|nr:Scd6-like Sm domain-containing protein [Annulohypoxylon maeteangense]KAI0884614.1 Scd6-like Sm domain-containing protein [Annulohypoxylon maeteangense]